MTQSLYTKVKQQKSNKRKVAKGTENRKEEREQEPVFNKGRILSINNKQRIATSRNTIHCNVVIATMERCKIVLQYP